MLHASHFAKIQQLEDFNAEIPEGSKWRELPAGKSSV